ncbi:MAG: electron transport complex subunit RsxG [Magnetococcus sp. DMHC-1]
MFDSLKMGLILMIVAGVCTAFMAGTEMWTREPIAQAKLQETLLALKQNLPPGFDNNPVTDSVEMTDKRLHKKMRPVRIYRARKGSEDIGAAFTVIAPDGYSGDIAIMIGLDKAGTVNSIKILEHKETPGLGDKIVITDWPDKFKGKNLGNAKWAVKKDGGEFDQFAGATITPRAVVNAVRRGLEFYKDNQDKIFARSAP